MPQVLTIAGSDSGGGAGIQADLKAFLALGAYGMSVITALTAQNTRGVTAIHAPPASFVAEQFASVSSDIRIDGIKIGMLANGSIAQATAEVIRKWRASGAPGAVVLDPVMVSTSGSLLLEHDAVKTVISELLPLCTLVTPNISEAVQIMRHANLPGSSDLAGLTQPPSIADTLRLSETIHKLGPPAVLLKGGHNVITAADLESQLASLGLGARVGIAAGDATVTDEAHPSLNREADASSQLESQAQDELSNIARSLGASQYAHGPLSVILIRGPTDTRVLTNYAASSFDADTYIVDVFYNGEAVLFVKPKVKTNATHGTGCTLSAAICAYAARGTPLRTAVAGGIQYLQESLTNAIEHLGSGPGPLDHGAHIVQRSVPKRSAGIYSPLSSLLISHSWDKWCTYTRHAFVARMRQGTLSPRAFTWFLRQDYIYLRHYARVWSKAASHPSCTLSDIGRYTEVSHLVVKETEMHVAVCAEWGISREELEATQESRATMVYTRSLLDHAEEGLLPLVVSVASCALGYAEAGLWLMATRVKPTPYDKWIEEYGGEDYQKSVVLITGASILTDLVEMLAEREVPSKYSVQRLQEIWDTCVDADSATRLEIGMWDEALAHGEKEA